MRADENLKEHKGKIDMLVIIDHGAPTEQQFGKQNLTFKGIERLAGYLKKDGVIVLTGCNVGAYEDEMVELAQDVGHRVRACPSNTKGRNASVKGVYWVEADPPGNIKYYERGDSKHPKYGKLPVSKEFVEYDGKGRGEKNITKRHKYIEHEGKTYIYDDKGKLIMIRNEQGKIRKPTKCEGNDFNEIRKKPEKPEKLNDIDYLIFIKQMCLLTTGN